MKAKDSSTLRAVYSLLTGWIDSRWTGGFQAAFVVRSLNLRAAFRARPPGPGERILDAGCGEGAALASLLARRYPWAEFTAVDLFPGENAGAPPNLRLIAADLSAGGLPAGFSAAYSLDLLEHVPSPEAVLKGVFAALAPGGRLYLHVPSSGGFAFFEAAQEGYRPSFREERAGDVHLREGFSEAELTGLLSCAGFSAVRIRRTFSAPAWFFKELYTLGERAGIPGTGLALLPFMLLLGTWDRFFPPSRGNGLWAEAIKQA